METFIAGLCLGSAMTWLFVFGVATVKLMIDNDHC